MLLDKLIACTCTCSLLVILLTYLFVNFLLNNEVKSKSLKLSIMTEDNSDSWATAPGADNISIIRTYTVYNFTNPDEVLWLNKTPILVEYGSEG